jgi:hypothetical protein
MSEFSELRAKAEQLPKRLKSTLKRNLSVMSCVTLFRVPSSNPHLPDDASTISKVAISLNQHNELAFMSEFSKERNHHHTNIRFDEYNELKTQILKGCYIFKWQQNNTLDSHNALIRLIKADLEITDLGFFDADYINSCLDEFSKYCTFVYFNKEDPIYSDLYALLGDDIQIDIDKARYPSSTPRSILLGVMQIMGMT